MNRKQRRLMKRCRIARIAAGAAVVTAFILVGVLIRNAKAPETIENTEQEQTTEQKQISYSVESEMFVTANAEGIVSTAEIGTYSKVEPEEIMYASCIPLGEEEQYTLFYYCREYGVPVEVALGVIQEESSFTADAVNQYDNCFGYMQINEINNEWLEEEIGVVDTREPNQNIQSGVYILSGFYEKYGDWSMALICYNCGENGAKENYFSKGCYESGYSADVLRDAAEWEIKLYD